VAIENEHVQNKSWNEHPANFRIPSGSFRGCGNIDRFLEDLLFAVPG
jgi:hypothetical protein